MKNIGIYVHIPFCKQKCKYCDFISFQCMEDKFEEYFKCLIKEIENKSEEMIDEIDTIYIGGGTPSIVPTEYIEQVLKEIFRKYKVSKNAEITIEVNPGTVDEEKLKKYLSIGINRLSIGLQSTNDKLLKMLGRVHTYKEFEDVFEKARNVGFKNINVDLMIGLPNQTTEDVDESLEKIIDKNPEHISVYSLIIEENTNMFDLINEGILELPSEDLERKMYWRVKETLELNGYNHYEISNFSKVGFESKHNMNCWNQHEYLGFGVAAHSYFDGMRYSNINDLKQYIENFINEEAVYNVVFHEKQDKEEMMKEYMILGLRKIEGVKISNFKNKFVDNPLYVFRNELEKLTKNDLLEIDEDVIKLTKKGLDFANMVWIEFV
ncbi:MAG: oxygen-independent coproporphyrinogen III oxidase [Clostridia bacterium]|nr:oxygen-independent coproporphyrinogen III oxidase [Clostridia bacterium]